MEGDDEGDRRPAQAIQLRNSTGPGNHPHLYRP
jgi:hypothetical protein